MIARLLDLYSFIVLAAIVLSWLGIDRHHPLARIVYDVTEPVLEPIRRIIPPMSGLDFSPMVLLFALQALKSLF